MAGSCLVWRASWYCRMASAYFPVWSSRDPSMKRRSARSSSGSCFSGKLPEGLEDCAVVPDAPQPVKMSPDNKIGAVQYVIRLQDRVKVFIKKYTELALE